MLQYQRSLLSTMAPLFEKISENTVLVRISAFEHAFKKDIDAVIAKHLDTILKTENLIMLIGTAMDPFRWRRNRSTPFAP